MLDTIRQKKPAVVFAPHVETVSGLILPMIIYAVGQAAKKEVGAIVRAGLYCPAPFWVDMKSTQVDVLISAPKRLERLTL